MKIKIEAESQKEFDSKRHELIRALAGSEYTVDIRKSSERSPEDDGEPYFDAQREILKFWDSEFHKMLAEIKKDIGKIVDL